MEEMDWHEFYGAEFAVDSPDLDDNFVSVYSS